MQKKISLIIIFFIALHNLFGQLEKKEPYNQGTTTSYINYTQNNGQWQDNVLYQADFRGGRLFLENTAFTFLFYPADGLSRLHPHQRTLNENDSILNFNSLRMEFVGANVNATITPSEKNENYSNYFLGNDKKKWKSKVPIYKTVFYKNIYPNISVKTFSRTNNVRYDFIVHPNGNTSDINLKFSGQDKLSIRNGKLIISTSVGEIEQEEPFAYQLENGIEKKINCHYKLSNNNLEIIVSEKYNKNLELIIDPTLVFATYTGSTSDNWGMTATYDNFGNAYTGGICFGQGYPTTAGAFQINFAAQNMNLFSPFDIVLTKFNATGSALIFSTYLGGNDLESPQSIICDNNNNLVLLGRSYSSNFPITANAYDVSLNGTVDITVTKFNATGTALLGSTFVGGSGDDGVNVSPIETVLGSLKFNYADDGRGDVLVDNNDNIYVASCTQSINFPTTPSCLQNTNAGMQDGILFKMNPNLTSMIFSTYLGGSQNDAAYNIALGSGNTLYVTGGTESSNFTSTPGSLHTLYMGAIDGFVSHISATGNAILQSSFIGTSSYDQSFFVQTDKFGNIYLYGQCSGNYPITPGVYSNGNSGQFIHELDSTLSFTIFSTEFGAGRGTPDIVPSAFLVDNCQNIYISGWGSILYGYNNLFSSTLGMPISPGAFMITTDANDFYFLVLDKGAISLLYATFFGGTTSLEHVDGGTSRFDKTGIIYQAICESCGGYSDMPTSPTAWSTTNNSFNCNNSLVKFQFDMLSTIAQASTNPTLAYGCAPLTITFLNNSLNALYYKWKFGDGDSSIAYSPTHIYSSPGNYTASLIAFDSASCNFADTIYMLITVSNLQLNAIPEIKICQGDSAQLMVTGNTAGLNFSWSPANSLSNASSQNPIAFTNASTLYVVTASDSFCTAKDSTLVLISVNQTQINIDSSILCIEDTIHMVANSINSSYLWSNGINTFNNNVTTAGWYTLTTTDSIGCVGIDSILVQNFTHVPIVSFDTILCRGVAVQLQTTNGPYIYQWLPINSLNNNSIYNPTALPFSTTIYTVTVMNGPCITTSTDTVTILSPAILNVTPAYSLILPGESVTFNAITNYVCNWSPTYALSCTICNTSVSSTDTNMVYYISITNEAGCVTIDTVEINMIPSLYIPNTFTPNGDGINEIFRPVCFGYKELEIYIYDRWGAEIYYYNTFDGGWDGTYKGKKVEIDVYVWKLFAKDYLNNAINKIGHVTVLR